MKIIKNKSKILRILLFLVVLITVFLFTIDLIIRSYKTYGLIPIGWDTGVHLYYTRLILDGQFDIMFNNTDGNNFLTFILTALLALIFSNNIIIARIVISIALPIILLVVFYFLSKKIYKNTFYALLSVIITANWLTTYRLSSDLHKTMFAFIFILPVFYLYDKENSLKRNRIIIVFLMILASFSQIEITILFAGSVISLEVYRIIHYKKIGKKNIINLSIVLISIIPAFIIAVLKSTRFITVSITYPVKLEPPNLEQLFMYFGGYFILFTLIGVFILLYKLIKGNFNSESLIGVFNIIIIFFVLLPSFIFENPTFFRRMSNRSITIILVPFLVIESIIWLKKIISKKLELHSKLLNIFSSKRDTYFNHKKLGGLITILLLIFTLSLSSQQVPVWAEIHQKPFISEKALTQLENIAENRNSSKQIISLMRDDQVKAYKNFGWAGLYFGYHYYFNGPSIFLAAGMLYPSIDPQQIIAMEEQIKIMKKEGINFPLNSTDIEIAIATELYSHPRQEELEIGITVGEGAYLISGSKISQLFRYYSYNGIDYYSYEGKWDFPKTLDYYSRLQGQYILGDEDITYALLFYYGGNYSISISHLNGALNTGGFSIYINDTYIDQMTYWGAMDYRNFTINRFYNSMTIGFLKIKPLMINQTDIIIKEIFVKLEG